MSEDNKHLAEDDALMARICWHYFKEGQTQEAIARHLQMTRKRVNQILGVARTSGFSRFSSRSILPYVPIWCQRRVKSDPLTSPPTV